MIGNNIDQFEQNRAPLTKRARRSTNRWMRKHGWSVKTRQLTFHYITLISEQLFAMLPITLLQVLVLAIFFRKSSSTPGIDAAGLISAVAGLVLFLEGLRVAIMPMALTVGNQLPQRFKLFWVLVVAFCLGVLVTYAEPAIAAIRPLARLVDPQSAPYLYYMMNQQQELLVLCIGLGVGLASVVGTVKFMTGISIKPFIAGALFPTVALACYMQWGNPHLSPILGVAWDCGGVTTGPVTVPILLSLGIGVMKAQQEKKQLQAVLEDAAVHQAEGSTLEGFGIVTLASLLPVLTVECMAIIIGATLPYDYVLEQASLASAQAASEQPAPADTSPVKEVIFGIRAIAPLVVALMLLVVVGLRQPLPDQGFIAEGLDDEESDPEEEGEDGNDVVMRHENSQCGESGGPDEESGDGCRLKDVGTAGDAVQKCDDSSEQRSTSSGLPLGSLKGAVPGTAQVSMQPRPRAVQHRSPIPKLAAAVVAAAEGDNQDYFDPAITVAVSITQHRKKGSLAKISAGLQRLSNTLGFVYGKDSPESNDSLGQNDQAASGSSPWGCCRWLRRYSSLIVALVMCQVGMILFNIGLTYGFTALGDMTGTTLPASFLAVPYEPNSPYYSYAGGIVLTMVVVFLLGFLATNAEPALNVLGQTVETLSNRKFTKRLLICAVCVGVAVGMCAGASKILFRLPLIYFILAKYTVACILTVVAKEAITAVAWDSAGVTTGPVTVPFVMSIGVGFSKAVGAPEGFGMLTIMSVAPIISVLITSFMRKPVKRAAMELARISKVSLARISRRSNLSSSQQNDAAGSSVMDFAAELARNPSWTPSLGRTSPGLGAVVASRSQLSRTSRPLQPIGEHSAHPVAAAGGAAGASGSNPLQNATAAEEPAVLGTR